MVKGMDQGIFDGQIMKNMMESGSTGKKMEVDSGEGRGVINISENGQKVMLMDLEFMFG